VDAFIKTGGSYAKLDHLTAMEINSIRPLLPHALDELSKLQKVVRIVMNFFWKKKIG
jgi:GINS complex subunit 2